MLITLNIITLHLQMYDGFKHAETNNSQLFMYGAPNSSEINTTLIIFFNGLETNSFTMTTEESVNITAVYSDSNDTFIDGATVKLTVSNLTRFFTAHPTFDQYNLTLKAEDLGVGAHFLEILGEKENYTTSHVLVTLFIEELCGYLQLFVDSVNITTSKLVNAELDQVLNITVLFKDVIDDTHISGANISLVGPLNKSFTENEIYKQYNTSINTSSLGQGIELFNIFAQKEGYVTVSIDFVMEINAKSSWIQIYLDGLNSTSLEIPIRKMLNITACYYDYKSGDPITGATVQVTGEGLTLDLIENLNTHQYSISINTSLLRIGVRFLHVVAQKDRYQYQFADIRIFVRRIYTNITTISGERFFTLSGGDDFTLQIQLTDLDSNLCITDALVQYSWIEGEGYLLDDDNDGIYEVTISDIPIGFYEVNISVDGEDDYDFSHPYYIQLNVVLKTTGLRLLLNDRSIDVNKSFTVSIRTILNIKVNYFGLQDGGPIHNANVSVTTISVTSERKLFNLTENQFNHQYSINIDTNLFGIGSSALYISCEKPNCQSLYLYVFINVVEDLTIIQIITATGIVVAIGVAGFLISYTFIQKRRKNHSKSK